MTHVPWLILGLALALCGGWVLATYREWDNDRRAHEAKLAYERWMRRHP